MQFRQTHLEAWVAYLIQIHPVAYIVGGKGGIPDPVPGMPLHPVTVGMPVHPEPVPGMPVGMPVHPEPMGMPVHPEPDPPGGIVFLV